ncbi:MAG: metal ABC transporter permease [Magnetococcales bacterium]|nr:metal ABC transporter permease [Magnetococcales bacterium]
MTNLYDYLMQPFVEFAFMRRALAACLAVALGCAPVGVFLVLRRMSLMGDALSHAILPGVAAGYLLAGLSLPVMAIGGIAAGVGTALLSGAVSRLTVLQEDASFAAFQMISLATGVTLISLKGGSVDLMHLLFGSILAVDDASLLLMAAVATLSLSILAVIYRPVIIDSFDPGYLRYGGGGWYALFLGLAVLNLVAAFQSLGSLMAIGIMMLPAIAARFWARTVAGVMAIAVVVALFSGWIGLLLSWHYRLPSGPAIVLTAGCCVLVSLLAGSQGSLWVRFGFYGRHYSEGNS